MSIMDFVNGGIVIAVVTIIQHIKNALNDLRKRANKKPINSAVWFIVVFLCGFPMALIINGANGFKDMNIYSYIRDVFLYTAAASFVFKTYSVGKKVKKAIETKE